MTRRRAAVLALAATSTLTLSTLAVTTATAADRAQAVRLAAQLAPQNGSGATGQATATVRGTTIEQIKVTAQGLTPDGPHAMHIHYGETARNECPTMAEASETREPGATARLTTSDGVPAYGPIVVSLTTTGDTSPDSGLALDRFPVSMGGSLSYSRSNIEFTDVPAAGDGGSATGTAKEIADAVRAGEGVVVVHGVDYNDDNAYDFASAGESDLLAAAPAEATDPTMCGVLHHAH